MKKIAIEILEYLLFYMGMPIGLLLFSVDYPIYLMTKKNIFVSYCDWLMKMIDKLDSTKFVK